MTARYVVVRALDGTEAIIPNETVITSTVVNHSYSDKKVRHRNHSADQLPQRPRRRDARAGRSCAQRIRACWRTPRPAVLITAFADNGIDLELGVWVNDPTEVKSNLRSDIYYVGVAGVPAPTASKFPIRSAKCGCSAATRLRRPRGKSMIALNSSY